MGLGIAHQGDAPGYLPWSPIWIMNSHEPKNKYSTGPKVYKKGNQDLPPSFPPRFATVPTKWIQTCSFFFLHPAFEKGSWTQPSVASARLKFTLRRCCRRKTQWLLSLSWEMICKETQPSPKNLVSDQCRWFPRNSYMVRGPFLSIWRLEIVHNFDCAHPMVRKVSCLSAWWPPIHPLWHKKAI